MDGRAVLVTRIMAALVMALVLGAAGYLALRPVDGTTIALMRLELLLLTGVLAFCVLFFERVAIRLIRTRGGRLRGPPKN